MIEKMFTPEEWYDVFAPDLAEKHQRHYMDATQELINERLAPYEEAMMKRVMQGIIPAPFAIVGMTILAMIEEIEIAREMKNIQ